eukprot:m.485073 g.485073  ORF g.485073 m.485073 type:complete len:490 (+) comp23651_c0_seq1:273-1742(+)
MAASPASGGGFARPTVKSFFVYNPVFDKSEATEHEKLLYFYPPDVPMDRKMNYVGLSEALVKYTSTFSDVPCEVVHTQKSRQILYNPEPDFWLSMSITVPCTQRTKDGKFIVEYHDDQLQDLVLKAMLKQTYRMYKLFNGPMAPVVAQSGRDAIVEKLEMFFPQYLHTIDLSSADLLGAFNGIQFLPLDKNTYLRIQSFINLTEETFPQIKYTVFLFNDHLVWSGLEQGDMRILFKYLTGGLLAASTASRASAGAASGLTSPSSATGVDNPSVAASPSASASLRRGEGVFITGPEDLSDPESAVHAPRLFVTLPDESEQLHLIIYQCGAVTYCCLIDGDAVMDLDFYKHLHEFVEKPLQKLGDGIAEQQAKRTPMAASLDVQYRYLYFNYMNLAQKSSFLSMTRKGTQQQVPSACLQYITAMHEEFEKSPEDNEMILKTQNDIWIVGVKSDQRELYVVFLNQKNAHLVEISEEIRRLSRAQFNNIFFID